MCHEASMVLNKFSFEGVDKFRANSVQLIIFDHFAWKDISRTLYNLHVNKLTVVLWNYDCFSNVVYFLLSQKYINYDVNNWRITHKVLFRCIEGFLLILYLSLSLTIKQVHK